MQAQTQLEGSFCGSCRAGVRAPKRMGCLVAASWPMGERSAPFQAGRLPLGSWGSMGRAPGSLSSQRHFQAMTAMASLTQPFSSPSR